MSPQQRTPWHRRPPPQWWPLDEPWPPPRCASPFEHRRARFVWRAGWYSFWPLWILIWLIASLGRWNENGGSFPVVGGAWLLLVCAVIAGTVAVVLRRLAGPVAEIVAGADRIAHRDYRVRLRVPEFGPTWVGDPARAFNAMATELEAQDEARRRLMADIAHELRTPLAIVQAKLEGLIDGVYPRDDEGLQRLLEDTRGLTRLVGDLGTLATAESGALRLVKEPTDIVALIDDVAGSLASRADAGGVVIEVEVHRDEEIEPVAVDPLRIREVLMNLIVNAIRYSPLRGRVVVAVKVRSSDIEIRIADTGAGIAEEELPRIFDRFYKETGSSGTGLGLTIARSLVEAHGGAMRAESQPGAGTNIFFSLPR